MADQTQAPLARLYLTVPAGTGVDALAAALGGGDVAAVLLPADADSALIQAAQSRDVAAIVGMHCGDSRHAAMMAGEAGSDYVAFTAPEPDRGPPETPHDAEHTGNFTWWQAVMEIPCVAMAAPGGPALTLQDVTPLVSAGADFVALDEAVWHHGHGPAAAVADANDRIARAER